MSCECSPLSLRRSATSLAICPCTGHSHLAGGAADYIGGGRGACVSNAVRCQHEALQGSRIALAHALAIEEAGGGPDRARMCRTGGGGGGPPSQLFSWPCSTRDPK